MLGGRRYYVTGRSRQEALQRLRTLRQRYEGGQLAPPQRLTFREWAEAYLREAEGRLRQGTLETYRLELAWLVRLLGRLRLSALTPWHIQRALLEMQAAGRGTRRLALAYAVLHSCLERARKLGLLGYNPCQQVERPRHRPREARDWGREEMGRFLDAAREDGRPLALMLALMLLTGLRPGEAAGLQWGDIDFGAGTLTVRRSVAWAGKEWHIGQPKSRAGARTLSLPGLAWGLLDRLPKGSVYLFWRERPPRREQVSAVMAELCQRAGVPRRPAHYLRHCHATLLAAQGLDVKTLQRRLGHSQASVTLDVYAHALSEMDRRAAELVERALGAQGLS
jgi:integrase